MRFATHSELEGKHALLSASKYHWLGYDDERFSQYLETSMAAAHGTRLHELAKELILLKQKLPNNTKTLNQFVNDAIGFKMTPELILFYSYNVFGTADAVKFDELKMILRIHDLKNGTSRTSMKQLMIYAALFCLEYDYKPHELTILLRIYQNDAFEEFTPDIEDITRIMDLIVTRDRQITAWREAALS